MSHIKPRDLVEFFLFGFVVVTLLLLLAFLDTAPLTIALWVAAGIAALLWALLLMLMARDRRREHDEVVYQLMEQRIGAARRSNPNIFDQVALFDLEENNS